MNQVPLTIVRPQPGPQTEFLASTADIVVYGGAAGGGKSHGLLLETLRFQQVPEFSAVVFRRTSPQITAPGGLWDKAGELFTQFGAVPNHSSSSWKFPSGAKVLFRHLQYDQTVHDWQGSEVPLLCFDELTHFTEKQFFYMLSRNRSACGVRPYVRATTNPGPGWVKRFLAPWVEKEYPNPARSGEVRWFTRVNGEIVWVDETWRDDTGDKPKSVTFVRSSIYDNQVFLAKDPGYLSNLKSLDRVEQARLLHGDWDVFEGAFFSEWSEANHVKPPTPVPAWHRFFGGLDYGKAAPFCFLLCASDDAGQITVIDEVYERQLQPSEQAQRVLQVLERYGVEPAKCPIWCDPAIFPPKDPKARAGQPGKYIAEEYWSASLHAVSANNDRLNGWARMREYLHAPGALTVFRGRCPNLIRTMPLSTFDEHRPEDLDTDGEDHSQDALRYALMSRPARGKDPEGETPPRKTDNRPLFLKRKDYYA